MKKLNVISFFAASVLFFSCANSPEGDKTEATDAKEVKESAMKGTELNVNIDNSLIEWIGAKPTGQHNGTVLLKSGKLLMNNGRITGGSFTMDMTSIKVLDLEEEEWNTKLVNHLKSEDFFSVEKFPDATFTITSVEKFEGIEEPK
ncbi:MAG: YceI family protein, partial [Bacteroidales bacterium]|nr:YceI family protein [Bacteroidales bacterium]